MEDATENTTTEQHNNTKNTKIKCMAKETSKLIEF